MHGSLQADTPDEFIHRLTHQSPEYAMEMISGEAGDLGEFRQIQIFCIVILDVIYDAIQTKQIFML
jgi:hypothetical protein